MPSFLSMIGAVAVLAWLSVWFSALATALRDLSRPRLEEYLHHRGKSAAGDGAADWAADHATDLALHCVFLRFLTNLFMLLILLAGFSTFAWPWWMRGIGAMLVIVPVGWAFSIALPQALAQWQGTALVGSSLPLLRMLAVVLFPLTKLHQAMEEVVHRLTGAKADSQPQQIEDEILSVVEEGEKEGVVDTQERQMIESVIQFRDTQVSQTMTARPDIVAVEIHASMAVVKQTFEQSGHSRIPAYDADLDHIVGVLYARDLLKHLGLPPEKFDLRSALRPAFFVPETKPLRDLLQDFRLQKVHMAIVLDEYGGTAGLVTIEDILEELVGDISDEHEPAERAMLERKDEQTWESDARTHVSQLNRTLGLNLPEDAGYDTLGGFLSTSTGGIPQTGAVLTIAGVRYTVLSAEPQKVNRVRIELAPPAPPSAAPSPPVHPGLAASAASSPAPTATAHTLDR